MAAQIKPRLLCVGTHHRTGTVWLRRVFHAIASELDIPYLQIGPKSGLEKLPKTGRTFVFNWASNYPPDLLKRADAQILHLIRDPRDILISGMHFHQVAPKVEKFLYIPYSFLDGKTYREHLSQLPDEVTKLAFEMNNKHHITIHEMLGWNYRRPNAIETRYEDLILDEDCRVFAGILQRFGFSQTEVKKGCEIFWSLSLFGGLKNREDRDARIKIHSRAGTVALWKTQLPMTNAVAYLQKYGDALIALGYERDREWLKTITHVSDVEFISRRNTTEQEA